MKKSWRIVAIIFLSQLLAFNCLAAFGETGGNCIAVTDCPPNNECYDPGNGQFKTCRQLGGTRAVGQSCSGELDCMGTSTCEQGVCVDNSTIMDLELDAACIPGTPPNCKEGLSCDETLRKCVLDPSGGAAEAGKQLPKLSIPIPDLPIEWKVTRTGNFLTIPWIGQYVVALYIYGLRLAAIAAVVVFIIGGFLYMTSAARPDNIKQAKSMMTSSVTAIVILLCSNLILSIINPKLTTFEPLKIEVIEKQELPDGDYTPECSQVANNPVKTGVDGNLQKVDNIWLQRPAATDFIAWMADAKAKMKIAPTANYGWRSAELQSCLYKTKPAGVAALPCVIAAGVKPTPGHQWGLAVDMNVTALSDEDYVALLDTGRLHKWINFVYKEKNPSTNVVGQAVDLGTSGTDPNWRTKSERWHFDWMGPNPDRDLHNFNPSCFPPSVMTPPTTPPAGSAANPYATGTSVGPTVAP